MTTISKKGVWHDEIEMWKAVVFGFILFAVGFSGGHVTGEISGMRKVAKTSPVQVTGADGVYEIPHLACGSTLKINGEVTIAVACPK